MKKRVVIFGTGDLGQCFYDMYKEVFNILFFVDNKAGFIEKAIPVWKPEVLPNTEFDVVYIASAHGLEAIYQQLTNELGIPEQKINRLWAEAHVEEFFIKPRIRFLENFAEYCYLHHLDGACAEVGVCTGDFAKEINRVFSEKKLYLFDAFEGFDRRDLQIEAEKNNNYMAVEQWIEDGSMDFSNTSVEVVCQKLSHPSCVEFKKGFFPETFDVDISEQFLFVNLDTDLYQPIKDGLELFYPRMVKGGIILVHDYYSMLLGVARAVDEFIADNSLVAFPVGDLKSIAIIKN